MNNLSEFNILSDNECGNINGGGVSISELLDVFITLDEHWDEWKSDFKKGWNSYKY